MSLVRLAIVGASGLFIVVLGYLIRFHGKVSLIAGYDPTEVTDEEGFAAFIGTLAIVTGVVTAAVGVLDYRGVAEGVLWYGFGAFTVFVSGLMVIGSNRYTR